MSRRTLVGAGVLATALLVLIFGNQAATDWIANRTKPTSIWGWFLRILAWPAWLLSPDQQKGFTMRDVLAYDLRAIFLILFVALVLVMVWKTVGGGAAAFLVGWACVIFASALAAFATTWVLSNATLIGALDAAKLGSAYGLFVGWIVGIATSRARGKPASA